MALDHHDVRFTAQGMVLHLSAYVRASRAADVAVLREAEAFLYAVRAMDAWLRRIVNFRSLLEWRSEITPSSRPHQAAALHQPRRKVNNPREWV